jgi:RHS repeat-associated protein
MPFGQPMLVQTANADGRTTAEGYSAAPWDGTNPAFVEQYMDLETGLEYFPARYLSSLQGRFQSPDPANAGANPGDPQTWNGYAYVGSNPLSAVDPTGLLAEAGGGGDDSGGGAGGAIVAFFVFIGDAIAGLFESGPSLSVPAYSGTQLVPDPTETVPSADSSTLAAFGALGLPGSPQAPGASGFLPGLAGAGAGGGVISLPGLTICGASGVCEVLGGVAAVGGVAYWLYKAWNAPHVQYTVTLKGEVKAYPTTHIQTGTATAKDASRGHSQAGQDADIRWAKAKYKQQCGGKNLTPEQEDRLHRVITKQGYSKEEILDLMKDLFGCPA